MQDLCEYLGGERVRLDEPSDPIDVPMGEANAGDEGANTEGGEEEPGDDDPPDGGDDPNVDDPNGDEIVHMALNGIPLNGLTVDRTDVHPGVHPEPEAEDGSDKDMGAETAEERRRRYLACSKMRYLTQMNGQICNTVIWTMMHMIECLRTPEPTGFDFDVQ